MTRAVLTPRAVWWRARAPVGLSKLCQLLALSAWHGIAQERSAGSSIKQISAPCAWRESPEPSPGAQSPETRAQNPEPRALSPEPEAQSPKSACVLLQCA